MAKRKSKQLPALLRAPAKQEETTATPVSAEATPVDQQQGDISAVLADKITQVLQQNDKMQAGRDGMLANVLLNKLDEVKQEFNTSLTDNVKLITDTTATQQLQSVTNDTLTQLSQKLDILAKASQDLSSLVEVSQQNQTSLDDVRFLLSDQAEFNKQQAEEARRQRDRDAAAAEEQAAERKQQAGGTGPVAPSAAPAKEAEQKRGLFSSITDMLPGAGVKTGLKVAKAGAVTALAAGAGGRIGGAIGGETGETVGQVLGGAAGLASQLPIGGKPTAAPVPTTTPTVPGAPPAAGAAGKEAAEAAAKKGVLSKAASVGGKALRFIPGVGLALAAGEAAYSAGSAAMDAEKTLGIKGRDATLGEKAAAGAGGLVESLSFGLISKEGAGGFLKGLTGAGKEAEAAKQQTAAAAAPAAVGAAAAARKADAAAAAPSAAPMTPPAPKPAAAATGEIKPKQKISGDEDVKAMIKQHEGVRTRPYKDSLGLWTVGVGHLIGDGKSLPPSMNREFSMAEVNAMFEEDYAHHKKAAQQIPGFNDMNQYGQGALTDLTFNMGPSWFKKWPTLQKQLKEGDTQAAAENLQTSKWYGQVGNRGPTIVSLVRAGGDEQAKKVPEAATSGEKPAPSTGEGTLMSAAGPVLSGSGEPIQTGAAATPPAPPAAEGPSLFASAKAAIAKAFGGGEQPAAAPVSMPSISASEPMAPPAAADAGAAPGAPASTKLEEVVKPKDSTVNLAGLNPNFKTRFAMMASEYEQKTGRQIQVNSGFRDPKEQAQLYAKFGSPRAAPPGRSRHESGVAIDINSADANQAISLGLFDKYGFTRPVPGETWHVEPVETAKKGGLPDNPFAPGQAIAVAGQGGKPVVPASGTAAPIKETKPAAAAAGGGGAPAAATAIPEPTTPPPATTVAAAPSPAPTAAPTAKPAASATSQGGAAGFEKMEMAKADVQGLQKDYQKEKAQALEKLVTDTKKYPEGVPDDPSDPDYPPELKAIDDKYQKQIASKQGEVKALAAAPGVAKVAAAQAKADKVWDTPMGGDWESKPMASAVKTTTTVAEQVTGGGSTTTSEVRSPDAVKAQGELDGVSKRHSQERQALVQKLKSEGKITGRFATSKDYELPEFQEMLGKQESERNALLQRMEQGTTTQVTATPMEPRSTKTTAISDMSEKRATAQPAPVIVNNVSTNQNNSASGGGGGGRVIPSPYANRGSLDYNTSFIAAS